MVKVISLSEEAYKKLKSLKGEKSFSEIVIEITSGKRKRAENIMKLAGAWKDDSEYWDNFKKEIQKSRDKTKLREYKW